MTMAGTQRKQPILNPQVSWKVRFESAFELKAGVFIYCFVYFCFLQAGMRERAS